MECYAPFERCVDFEYEGFGMSRGKLSRVSVGIYLGMILCCLKLTAQTNTFPSSGNVGIGTTAPSRPLDVSALGYGTLGPAMRLSNTGGQVADKARIEFADAGYLRLHLEWNIVPGGAASWNFYDDMNSASRMFIDQNGNVGIGTTNPGATLEVNGNLKLTTGSGASMTFPDGSIQSTAWNGTTLGGDYAETVDVAGNRNAYEPGDVMVIGLESDSDVVKSNEPYSTRVAGIYSTKPGVVGRRQTIDPKTSTTEIPMAMVGIVPTKVSAENGAISRGDSLVTATIPGYAMKGTDRTKMLGAVVGKAMGSLSSGTGVIEVLVTLQ